MPIQVKDVIATAAGLAGREDLAQAAAEARESEEIDVLVRCFNLVENEVALDHIPLKKRETVSAEDGKIAYAKLSEAPIDILSVRSTSGMDIPFELLPDAIGIGGGAKEAEIVYAFAPRKKELGGTSDYSGKVSERLLAMGAAAEFLLAQGRYEEAAAFEKRFRDAVRAANIVRHKLAVRARRWA